MKSVFASILTLAFAATVYAEGTAESVSNTKPLTTTTTTTTEVVTTQPTLILSDAEISNVLVKINEGEIESSRLAAKKAQSPAVKEFAKMMRTEHVQNVRDIKGVAQKENIVLKKTDLADSLGKEALADTKDLKKTDKSEFDRKYIALQIKMHQRALTTLRETLIPNAKNENLASHLRVTEQAVAAHLEHAQNIETQLR